MSFIQREIEKLESALTESNIQGDIDLYDQLYAARQALAWATDPMMVRSPYYMLMDMPTPEHEKAPLADM